MEDSDIGLEGSPDQTTAIALQAANTACQVPGVAYKKRRETKLDEPAWRRTVKDYAQWVAPYRFLIYCLLQKKLELLAEGKIEEAGLQYYKAILLLAPRSRAPGEHVTPGWPIEAHQEHFQSQVPGVCNPISFAIGRIFREHERSISHDQEACRDFQFGLVDRIIAIKSIKSDADFLLQIGNCAVELGASKELVLGSILNDTYLLKENRFHRIRDQLLRTLESGDYPFLQ